MFTGIIQTIGQIHDVQINESGKQFEITCPEIIKKINIDDSVSVNGVCLTATEVKTSSFVAQAVHVTLEKTTLNHLNINSAVNLELALRMGDPMGGHQVQGHVNGVIPVKEITGMGENFIVTFDLPTELADQIAPYIVNEGSIAIDGTSLTIAKADATSFKVSIIPHTWSHTIFHCYQVGSLVNVEVDIMAKHLEKLLTHYLKTHKLLAK